MKKLIIHPEYCFRTRYFADDNGHIWSEHKQNYLTEDEDKDGYKKVLLMTTDKPVGKGHRFSVHRLILSTFNPIPDMRKYQVDHINGNRQDNQLSNLRWTTCKENLANENTRPHRRVYDQNGTHNASAILTKESLISLIDDANSGNFTRQNIYEKYNIGDETLRRILKRETYTDDTKNLEINPKFISCYARDTSGEKNGRAKLNNERVLEIIRLLKTNKYSYKEIGDMYGVSSTSISAIKNKKTWRHLTKDITFN